MPSVRRGLKQTSDSEFKLVNKGSQVHLFLLLPGEIPAYPLLKHYVHLDLEKKRREAGRKRKEPDRKQVFL